MTGPLGNGEFCFPRISMFPSTSSQETLQFSGNKIHCSPRDQTLSIIWSTIAHFGLGRTQIMVYWKCIVVQICSMQTALEKNTYHKRNKINFQKL